ncbi:MAG: Hsp33 family molecular chaperone [Cohaesibacteraceae bacterium]|nr:Hsp33 family molecular chaperone [Cohaesibacteraceae bacterium]MBL4876651.1 Hsp33 family molecular chaperone [Cohaesibacteraceae bacterium]
MSQETGMQTSAQTMPDHTADDRILPFQVDKLDLRGRIAHMGPLLDKVLSQHDYPVSVSRLLGEAVVLAALVGSSLKFSGRFILQTKTDGPVSLLVADFDAPDGLRAYASYDEERLAEMEKNSDHTVVDLIGNGHLALTIDQGGNSQPYQGVVELKGVSLEGAVEAYFVQSEQIPTRIRVAIAEMLTRGDDGKSKESWRAGGLFLQFLPESEERIRQRDLDPGDAPKGEQEELPLDDDDAWSEADALITTLGDHELTDPQVGGETLLYRLFHERGVRVYDEQHLVHRCRCSEDRVRKMIETLDKVELADLVEEGLLTVSCQFCGLDYAFEPSEYGITDESVKTG